MAEQINYTQILEDIKKLLILDLMVKGVKTTDIANILGVNKSTVSRLVPVKKLKGINDK